MTFARSERKMLSERGGAMACMNALTRASSFTTSYTQNTDNEY